MNTIKLEVCSREETNRRVLRAFEGEVQEPVISFESASLLFKVLTQIQDEVHRYAITFHRDKRSKHALHSELDDIKGIGPKAKEALLSKFKSVKKMKEASFEQLSEVLGPHKAEILSKYFEEKGENMK